MNETILHLLNANGRISFADIAEQTLLTESEVAGIVAQLETDGIIKGYKAVLDDAALPECAVRAVIQVQTHPEREGGFDRVAKRIARFPEVESLFLMSGAYDLQVVVTGRTLQDVAYFVSSKLSPIEGVVSTATHFILKKFKESGVMMAEEVENERLQVIP